MSIPDNRKAGIKAFRNVLVCLYLKRGSVARAHVR